MRAQWLPVCFASTLVAGIEQMNHVSIYVIFTPFIYCIYSHITFNCGRISDEKAGQHNPEPRYHGEWLLK